MNDDNFYQFVTTWRIRGTRGEVADVLGDPLALPKWWPSVYLEAEEIDPGDSRGVGRRVRLLTQGWLPYRLRWQLVVTRSDYPERFTIAADGDFVGTGEWRFEQRGDFVEVVYDWRVRAEKPLLRQLSFVLKPLFAANHRWAMAQGEISLALELERRRAASSASGDGIEPPPGPVTYSAVALLAGAGAVGAGLMYLMVRARRRRRRRQGTD